MNEAEYLKKNYGDLGGCYPSRPYEAEADNTLRDLHNFSSDTQPHSLIVKYAFDLNYIINSRGKNDCLMRCREWRQISLILLLVNCHDVTSGIFDR